MNQKIHYPLALVAMAMTACHGGGDQPSLSCEHQGDTLTVISVSQPTRYILLPIQEDKPDVPVRLNVDGQGTWMDIRLAIDSADYYVPFRLNEGQTAIVEVKNLPATAAAWGLLKLSNEFDTTNTEYYRPAYHFTPAYGWMNDPNGMTYLDGEYHLFYQYNPYGSKWGNMHWGHAVSPDMVHWTELEPAIERDEYGQIFSGSSYIARLPEGMEGQDPFEVDRLVPGNGTEGDFIASYYTSDNWRMEPALLEQQSFAISTDRGRTYRKLGAPVLKSDGRRDFRDPKLFWNEQRGEWGMIVSADNEMQFYGSQNLRDWQYVSAFGDGYGVQPRMFECPDFFWLPVEQEAAVDNRMMKAKWVMIVNVNPGCWFGGSASQYFTGEYDGTNFTCDDPKETVKWLDWGKDHYAAVTFSCEPQGRIISIPWMSNWQYANDLPTRQYRSQMGMARQLFAFVQDGETYVGQRPVAEMEALLQPAEAEVAEGGEVRFGNGEAQICVELDVKNGTTFTLENEEGELVYFACKAGRLLMDRQQSGIIPTPDFASETWQPLPELGLTCGTWAPVEQLCGKKDSYHVQLWLDKCSVEMFIDGGKATMTNLVYPHTPYNMIKGEGIENVKVSNIKM